MLNLPWQVEEGYEDMGDFYTPPSSEWPVVMDREGSVVLLIEAGNTLEEANAIAHFVVDSVNHYARINSDFEEQSSS